MYLQIDHNTTYNIIEDIALGIPPTCNKQISFDACGYSHRDSLFVIKKYGQTIMVVGPSHKLNANTTHFKFNIEFNFVKNV